MVLMDFRVPIQSSSFAAAGTSILSLYPIKFPALIYRREPVDIVWRMCIKSIAVCFAGIILDRVFLAFIFEHLIIF
jgi:hypothetical protein